MMETLNQHQFSRREVLKYAGVGLFGLLSGVVLDEGLKDLESRNNRPQGYWNDAKMIDANQLYAEMTAYMLKTDEGIDHVDLGIIETKDDRQDWVPVCRMEMAARTDTFECTVDISKYVKPGDTVTVGFNVYGTNGKRSDSPSGYKFVTIPQAAN